MFDGNVILSDATGMLNSFGEPISVLVYEKTFVSGASTYDDDVTFTRSGVPVWTHGMIFPISNAKRGSSDAMLLEQGKLLADDMLVYLPGNVSLSGAAVLVGFGSPTDEVRQIIFPGVGTNKAVSYVNGYTKVWTRIMKTGSYIDSGSGTATDVFPYTFPMYLS